MTSFSSNSENVRQALIAFLEGRRSLDSIRSVLHDQLDVDFSDAPGRRVIHGTGNEPFAGIEIQVLDEHLYSMLQRYIQGSVTGIELSDWASFIFMSGFYVPEGSSEAERERNGEGILWDLLQRLITPQIFDGLNPDVASDYLALLQESS